MSGPRLVILESPYAGDVERNVAYARRALSHSLTLGEAPIASHLLYTQPGVLNDNEPGERKIGIAAGLAWAKGAQAAVFYVDHGLSQGMQEAAGFYLFHGIPIEQRTIGAEPDVERSTEAFDAGARALFDDTMAGRFADPAARPKWSEVDEEEKADWRGTVRAIVEAERLACLPCKSGEGANIEREDTWSDFFNDHMTDGNDGYRAADVIQRCRVAFDAAWPRGWEAAHAAGLAALTPDATQTREAGQAFLDAFDAAQEDGGHVLWKAATDAADTYRATLNPRGGA